MAWYEIPYSCGHLGRVQIYGTNVHGERERTAAAMARGRCKDCSRDQARAAAIDRAVNAGLPALTGSEKQIGWAVVLRDKALRKLDPAMAQPRDTLADIPARERIYRGILTGVDAAARWIDHRELVEHPVPDLITALAGETDRRRLAEQTARELAALAAAAAEHLEVESDPTVAAATATVRTIAAPAGLDGPVLELPDPVRRAHTIWREVCDCIAEPARITRLRPAILTGLSTPTLPAHLVRVAVRTALAEPVDPRGAARDYTAAALLLGEYRRHAGTPATVDSVAEPDGETSAEAWWVRARVRVLRESRCGARTVAAGEVLALIQYGLPGWHRISALKLSSGGQSAGGEVEEVSATSTISTRVGHAVHTNRR